MQRTLAGAPVSTLVIDFQILEAEIPYTWLESFQTYLVPTKDCAPDVLI